MSLQFLNRVVVPAQHFLRKELVYLLVARLAQRSGLFQEFLRERRLDPLVAMKGAGNQVVIRDIVPFTVTEFTDARHHAPQYGAVKPSISACIRHIQQSSPTHGT